MCHEGGGGGGGGCLGASSALVGLRRISGRQRRARAAIKWPRERQEETAPGAALAGSAFVQ